MHIYLPYICVYLRVSDVRLNANYAIIIIKIKKGREMQTEIGLEASWLEVLREEFAKPYMQELKAFLVSQREQKKNILPRASLWFNALNFTPLSDVKVVILGQDPYPTIGHAHGLCFSVLPEVKPLPKSLININQELQSDLGVNNMHTGYLQPWAKQGVLLLNAVLTVEAGKSNAHQGKGWEQFTDKVIEIVNQECHNIVFILWGSYAQKKGSVIDPTRHLIIKSPHPSPLSAHRGFFGSKPFSRTNDYLVEHGKEPINWQL
jgi:uracil-DNA glycosylase